MSEPRKLLEWAHDLGKTYAFLDSHVHPFDVLTGETAYQKNERCDLLFSKGSSVYHEPLINAESAPDSSPLPTSTGTERTFLLASRLKYAHTGAKVISDQLSAAGLSGALLLPVARLPGKTEEMLDITKMMFPNEGNVYSACAYPVGLPMGKLTEFFCTARKQYKICAIKLHLNLIGIDPATRNGQDLVEATLDAAGALGLPIIIHGGRTTALKPSDATEYGVISHLETINWSLSTAPVIIAHAGCYELGEDEASEALCKLDALFQKHPNLMADTSNLGPLILRLVLKKVSPNRLIFGSDALYVPIWKSWLGFLHALQDVSLSPDDDLIQIASLNPVEYLGIPFFH